MKCDINGCEGEANYSYDWEQSDNELELNLCIYCNAQLHGEMQKQVCLQRMLDDVQGQLP